MNPIKVILYDDHPAMIVALANYLDSKPQIEVHSTFTNTSDLLAFGSKHKVDVVITDIMSHEEIGVALIPQLRKTFKKAKIVVFSGITSEFIIKSLKDLGADEFVCKKEPLELLQQKVLESKIPKVKKKDQKSITKLTTKEKQIIKLIREGKSAKEISEITKTSFNTINNQKNHLIKKFECSNTNE